MKSVSWKSKSLLWAFLPWNVFVGQVSTGPEKHFPSSIELKIGTADCKSGVHFQAKTASTEHEREIGLSGRKKPLGKNEGMAFLFESPQPVRFWMKNTLIPLTILFFTESGELLSAQEMSVEANPNEPARFYTEYGRTSVALEIGPGNAQRFKPHETFLCGSSVQSSPSPGTFSPVSAKK